MLLFATEAHRHTPQGHDGRDEPLGSRRFLIVAARWFRLSAL